MEPGGSLPHSQEPATCPYPEPAQSMKSDKMRKIRRVMHVARMGEIKMYTGF
jgi:hypothetical protein